MRSYNTLCPQSVAHLVLEAAAGGTAQRSLSRFPYLLTMPRRGGQKVTAIWAAALRVALAISALLLVPSTTLAENATVSLEVVPGEIELCGKLAGKQLPPTFQVVARNNGTAAVSGLTLKVIHDTLANFDPKPTQMKLIPDTGANFTQTPARIDLLPPGSSTKWDFSATEPPDGVIAAKVHFLLAYRTGKTEGNASAALDIKQRSREPLEKMATAVMSLGSSALDESQPVDGYLIVTNLSEHGIEATIVCHPSNGLTLDYTDLVGQGLGDCLCANGEDGPACCKSPEARKLKLMPGGAVPVPIRISANGARAGNRKIAFETNLSWNDRGCAYTATLVTTQDLAVGLFGQSEILTAFGIPSLLVLPGVLIMLVVGMVWKAGVRFGSSTAEFPYQVKAPEFWLFAISLSFAAVLVGRYVFDRPYLTIYRLADLMWLWFLSVLVGGLVFLIADLIYIGVILPVLRWLEGRHKPLPDDDPQKVLEKLGRLKRSVYLPRLRITATGTTCFRFFPLRRPLPEKCWVVPAIVLTVKKDGPPGTRDQVEEQRSENGDPAVLAEMMREGSITGSWQTSAAGDLQGPKEIKESELTELNVAGGIVEDVQDQDG
jgi:hypothetical protein